MDLLRHRWSMSAFKCILSVICLALFTTQLSFRFYQSSSLSFINYNEGTSRPISHKGENNRIYHYHSHPKIYLSLDKRYNIPHFIALPPTVFAINALHAATQVKFPVNCDGIKASFPFSVADRAPPAA
jgi:hypothetical protein